MQLPTLRRVVPGSIWIHLPSFECGVLELLFESLEKLLG